MAKRISLKIGSNSDVARILDTVQRKHSFDPQALERLKGELTEIKGLCENAGTRKGIFFLEKDIQLGGCVAHIQGAEPLRISLFERLTTIY